MRHLDKFISRFNVDGTTPVAAAKTWACLEAIIKSESGNCCINNIRIVFDKNSAPKVIELCPVLKYSYTLSVSHEDDLVVAVAVGQSK